MTGSFGEVSLVDKDAIRDLVLTYSRAVDRQDFALLKTLYTEDAVEDDHGGLYSGSATGYIDWLKEVMPRLGITIHAVHNHLIGFDSADRAQGEVGLVGYHRLPNGKGGWDDLIHGMRYLDHYAKTGGRWRFARRTVCVDWKQFGPSVWNPADPEIKDAPFGTHDAKDPSYRVLTHPLFARRD